MGGVIPDKLFLSIAYRIKMGKWINWKNPQRMSEKIQLYKIYYRNVEMLPCTDKFLVRNFVTQRLGTDKYLNELFQICNRAEEIDFDKLPLRFVIKTTDGGGGNNIFICKDKRDIDKSKIIKEINGWRNNKLYVVSRQWAYIGAKNSRIIAEKLLEEEGNSSLTDYKFFCFDGIPFCIQVDSGRFEDHRQNFYDLEWNDLGVHCSYPLGEGQERPCGLDEMIEVAKKLSAGFPCVRVDLYNIKGKIIFGEMTFYPSSGYGKFDPDSFDYEMGKFFNTDFNK